MMYGWIVILVVIIAGVWYMNKRDNNPFTPEDLEDTPLDVLKKRYARGEISEEEFKERKDLLERDM